MHVLVKLCGMNSSVAVDAAVEAGADALGFVLVPSPRRVSLAQAEALLGRVPPGVERIAVFRRATRAEIAAALALPFDGLQAELGSELPPLPEGVFFLPALRDASSPAPLASPGTFAASGRTLRGAVVLDGPLGGGRGIAVDEARARELTRSMRLVLAGGLTPENVAAKIRAVRPFAVDSSSGVESRRGVKDPARIRAFVQAVRALEAELAATLPGVPS